MYADGRSEVLGGVITNTGNSATSGLIVLGGVITDPNTGNKETYGRVGIGFGAGEIPNTMLEVKNGDVLLHQNLQIGANMRVSSDGISHFEERSSGSYKYTAYGNCRCLEARRDGSRLAEDRLFSPFAFGRRLMKYLGTLVLPAARAVPLSCYSTQDDCLQAGGSYCFDYGDSCVPGEYDSIIICSSAPTQDAQCDPGDTPIAGTERTYSCYGVEYIGRRQCLKSTSGGVDWFDKIRFEGMPSPGQPSRTVIDDNLVAENNVAAVGKAPLISRD